MRQYTIQLNVSILRQFYDKNAVCTPKQKQSNFRLLQAFRRSFVFSKKSGSIAKYLELNFAPGEIVMPAYHV